MKIQITSTIFLDESEFEFTFIRSPGPGGQNVNKVASGIQLRFNIANSPNLPEHVRTRLLELFGNKITKGNELLIKAFRFRTQESNKKDAIDRLIKLIKRAAFTPKKRKKTKPTLASKERRLKQKKLHGKTKSLRQYKSGSD